MENTLSRKIYDFLVTRDLNPEIRKGKDGKAVSDPEEAELFSFDWVGPSGRNYGTVVILINPDTGVELYTADNLGKTMEPEDKNAWLGAGHRKSGFIPDLKLMAVSSMSTSDHAFNVMNLNRLKYNMQGIAAIREGLFEGYYGKKKISYSDQPQQTRLMIRHNRDLQEGEPRYRAIESLFVENADGERFRVPSRNLIHGRMLARHLAEGGNPYDAFGQHINTIMEELMTLSRFIRASRNRGFQGPASDMIESAVRHYTDLKAKAKRMIGQRGYREEREQFDPAVVTEIDDLANEIREMFIQQSLDERIEEALPILARLAVPVLAKVANRDDDNMKEIREFESWAHKVTEGTWALPDTPEEQDRLRQLMSEPLPVGADATNATEQLYDILGDDDLFDQLSDLAAQDSDADARVLIKDKLEDFGITIEPEPNPEPLEEPESITEPTPAGEPLPQSDMAENISIDGVLMTRGPNPNQFESAAVDRDLNRLLELARR